MFRTKTKAELAKEKAEVARERAEAARERAQELAQERAALPVGEAVDPILLAAGAGVRSRRASFFAAGAMDTVRRDGIRCRGSESPTAGNPCPENN